MSIVATSTAPESSSGLNPRRPTQVSPVAIGTILRAVRRTSWMSARERSRMDKMSLPAKRDIGSHIHRTNLKDIRPRADRELLRMRRARGWLTSPVPSAPTG